MEIVVKFLVAMQALMLAMAALYVVVGIGIAIAGLFMRKVWMVAIGLVLAFGQFVWPWVSNKTFGNQIEARRAFVQNLPKAPVPADYPRRLVLEGDIDPNPPAWFIGAGYVDEVDVANYDDERTVRGERLVAAGDAAACRKAALAIANPDGPTEREKYEGNPYPRIKACTRAAGPSSPNADAVILRVGNRTTLFDRENARRHGAPNAIQLSLRRGGKEVLLHYDEMPILASPKSATRLLPEGYEYPCKRFAYFQIVANLLDAARQPARASALLKRGAVRRSEYDDCIASIAPYLKDDARGRAPD
jgi:hypothetical protein